MGGAAGGALRTTAAALTQKQRDDIKRAFKLKKAWYERLLKSEPGVLDYLMTAEDGKAVRLAAAMEELNQLAEDLKNQVGGAADDFTEDAEEAGAGGLLDEVGGMLADAMAAKRSKMRTWRVREVVAVGFKMMAATPDIKGVVAEEVQGALIKRRAFETNDKVLAVLGAADELPKRLAKFAVTPGGGVLAGAFTPLLYVSGA